MRRKAFGRKPCARACRSGWKARQSGKAGGAPQSRGILFEHATPGWRLILPGPATRGGRLLSPTWPSRAPGSPPGGGLDGCLRRLGRGPVIPWPRRRLVRGVSRNMLPNIISCLNMNKYYIRGGIGSRSAICGWSKELHTNFGWARAANRPARSGGVGAWGRGGGG